MDETTTPIRNYKVALLFLPDQSPEVFTDYEEAETRATENSIDDDVWGLWDTDADHLEAIAYQGNIYSA